MRNPSPSGYMAPLSAKTVVRRYFQAYNTQRPEAVMAFVHEDHIYHPPGVSAPMDRRGRQSDEAPFFAAFSEIETVVEEQIAEGDRVASRITMRCTHSGPYHGRAATGRRITIPFLDFSRVQDGKILEEWAEFDALGLLAQLDAEPKPARPARSVPR